MCCFDLGASDPDGSLDDNGGYHCEDGCRRKRGNAVVTARQQLLDRLLKDLDKRNHHDDGKDKDTDRLEALAANGKPFPQSLKTPAH